MDVTYNSTEGDFMNGYHLQKKKKITLSIIILVLSTETTSQLVLSTDEGDFINIGAIYWRCMVPSICTIYWR